MTRPSRKEIVANTVGFVLVFAALVMLGPQRPEEPIEVPKPKAERVLSSWYGAAYQGKPTTSGELFDRHGHTAAHPSLPFGTRLLLRNPANGEEILVRVNDRGPFCEYPGSYYYSCKQKRGLDVSEHVAESLGFKQAGIMVLEMTVLEDD